MKTKDSIHCLCTCGHTQFSLRAKPKIRFFCHCTICQTLYQKPFSDFTVVWGGDVQLAKENDIDFQKYRMPPALQRGKCVSCTQPAVAFLTLVPGIRLAFVPSQNFSDQSLLPESSGHLFCHRRVIEIDDTLPKYSGYWSSEWAVSSAVFSRLVFNKR